MSLSPVAKVVKDQQATANDPLKNPFYSMQIACSIVRGLQKKLNDETGKTGNLHPYVIAIALKFGNTSEVLKLVLQAHDPYDLSSSNSLAILTSFQSIAYELHFPQKDILFLDFYQKVYDETTANNLNTLK